MRLLDAQSLEVVKFFGKEIPPYAILSHTWGDDDDEVSYQDIKTRRAREKKGFAKIRYCCKQALADGIHYAWVDTCCIDKRNNTELAEAINSMFHWYAKADICYAYLSDVPGKENTKDIGATITRSRWLTRGWTLQELLAPPQLFFFADNWKRLGSREEWKGR